MAAKLLLDGCQSRCIVLQDGSKVSLSCYQVICSGVAGWLLGCYKMTVKVLLEDHTDIICGLWCVPYVAVRVL